MDEGVDTEVEEAEEEATVEIHRRIQSKIHHQLIRNSILKTTLKDRRAALVVVSPKSLRVRTKSRQKVKLQTKRMP